MRNNADGDDRSGGVGEQTEKGKLEFKRRYRFIVCVATKAATVDAADAAQ